MSNIEVCKSLGCDGEIYAKGFCKSHYGRWQMAGYRQNHPEYVHRSRNKAAIAARKRRIADPGMRARDVVKTAEWRRKLKKEIFEQYGNQCACCGETEPKFLQLDHVNGGGTKERKELNGRPWTTTSSYVIYTRIRNRGFPKGEFQILCANCNFGKSVNGGVCPHVQASKLLTLAV